MASSPFGPERAAQEACRCMGKDFDKFFAATEALLHEAVKMA
jgi:hypothetical protein